MKITIWDVNNLNKIYFYLIFYMDYHVIQYKFYRLNINIQISKKFGPKFNI